MYRTLEGLDRQVDAGGIASYGVSITTLDEVFLLVARGEMTTEKKFGSSQHNPVSASTPGNRENSVRSQMDLEKDGMFFRHLRALFQKRAAFFRRDKKAWCCTTVLPSIFVCFGFIIFKLVTPDRNLEPVVLDLNDYNAGVQTLPKNPIIFNEQESIFPCQPASCAYQTPIVKEDSTNEFYSFCGYRSRVNASYSCTINESRNIIEEITDAGASAQGINVNSIFSVRCPRVWPLL